MTNTPNQSNQPIAPGFWGKLLGIEKVPGKFLGRKFKFRFFFFAALILIVLPLGGATYYSTQPAFCRSCHIMEPYYQAWANSLHKNVASCVDCHYPPGAAQTILWKKFQALSQVVKYVTRTYSSKPFAEIEDTSCLRSGCHSTRLLRGKVISKKGIHFDHKPHLEGVRNGRQLRCVSCHSQLVVGKHIEVTWDSCYLCHLKGRKQGRHIEVLGGCLGCHTMPEKAITVGNITYNHKEYLAQHNISCESCHQDVIQGDGEVTQDRCMTCHNQPEKLARYTEIEFIHTNHVTKHNTACFHCHKEIIHRATPAGKKSLTLDCSACHANTHTLQRTLYMGTGAKGIPAMPSPMYLANVDCISCHVEKKANDLLTNETLGGSEKGCTECHGKEYTGVLKESHTILDATHKKVGKKLAAIKSHLAANTGQVAVTAEVTQNLDDANYNIKFIGMAHSVHNIYYASQILRKTDEQLTNIAEQLKVKVDDLSEDPAISGSFCATLCHSKIGIKVPAETKPYLGKIMPHKEHIERGLACTGCHLFGSHKDVKLKNPTICHECHDEEKK